ncbi:hypothetical protein GQ457_06G007260 [Hibiscus cannabinus]
MDSMVAFLDERQGHILLIYVSCALLVKIIGKLPNGTIFVKKAYDEEPFEFKIEEQVMIWWVLPLVYDLHSCGPKVRRLDLSFGLKFTIGDDYFCPTLTKAVKTMKKWEKVMLTVKPQCAFLKDGEGYERPNDGILVQVKIIGKLPNGTIFVKNAYDEEPFEFKIEGTALLQWSSTVKSLIEDLEEEIKKFEKSFSIDEFIEIDFANDLCWEVEDFEEEIMKFEKKKFIDETNCVDKSCRGFNCVDDEFREFEQNFSIISTTPKDIFTPLKSKLLPYILQAPDIDLNPPPEHLTKGYTLSKKFSKLKKI